MKVAVIVEINSTGYSDVETVLLYESNARKALETFAAIKNVEPRITNMLADHWRLAVSYRAVDGKNYDAFYTAVIKEGIDPLKPSINNVPHKVDRLLITGDGRYSRKVGPDER